MAVHSIRDPVLLSVSPGIFPTLCLHREEVPLQAVKIRDWVNANAGNGGEIGARRRRISWETVVVPGVLPGAMLFR